MSTLLSPLSVKCPMCLARPGVKCLTKRKRMKSGKTINVHFKRVQAWRTAMSMNKKCPAAVRVADVNSLNGEPLG